MKMSAKDQVIYLQKGDSLQLDCHSGDFEVTVKEIKLERLVSDLSNYEPVYIIPWALYKDENGFLWIKTDVSFSKKPSGTHTLRICIHGYEGSRWANVDKSTVEDDYIHTIDRHLTNCMPAVIY